MKSLEVVIDATFEENTNPFKRVGQLGEDETCGHHSKSNLIMSFNDFINVTLSFVDQKFHAHKVTLQ